MPIRQARSGTEVATAPRSLLRPALLVLLNEHDDHGYALLDRLGAVGLGGVDSGGMYRMLRSLEQERAVKSWWSGAERGVRRRVYALTERGYQQLRHSVAALVDQRDAVGALVDRATASCSQYGSASKIRRYDGALR